MAKTSLQAVNVLFSFCSHLQNTVLWLCTADYKKQLFLNDNFSNIWGIPKEQMYNDISVWKGTIYPDDLKILNKAFEKRDKKPHQCNSAAFRVQRPDSQLRYIKSLAYTFCDQDGKPAVILGIDENLSIEQWDQTKNDSCSSMPLLDDLSQVLNKEFKLILPIETHLTESQELSLEKIPKNIKINNNIIPLTERESQCLIYLMKGKSAKETAYLLKISTRTVETYLDKIRYKAKCRTKLALIGKLQQHLLV